MTLYNAEVIQRLCWYVLPFKNETVHSIRITGDDVGCTNILSVHSATSRQHSVQEHTPLEKAEICRNMFVATKCYVNQTTNVIILCLLLQIIALYRVNEWFLSLLWHCWLGNRKGIGPVKNFPGVGLLVMTIWYACSIAPVDTITSIILRTSAIADKPGDALEQSTMAWLTPKIHPSPCLLPCQIWSSRSNRVCISGENPPPQKKKKIASVAPHLLKKAPPHMRYHAELGRSMSQGGNPKIGERWVSAPMGR